MSTAPFPKHLSFTIAISAFGFTSGSCSAQVSANLCLTHDLEGGKTSLPLLDPLAQPVDLAAQLARFRDTLGIIRPRLEQFERQQGILK